MSRLVIVVPLREGVRDEARRLLEEGPPFALEETRFDRHEVYLTASEAVFVFEAPRDPATLDLRAEDPALWRAAAAWRRVIRGRPRVAETAFTWRRGDSA
ncbi:MAG TPA: hypothetical protein VHF67_01515 [Gaiellaceae bacterium]|nr:hypothetical protein [Gaiellaceae bacterium]